MRLALCFLVACASPPRPPSPATTPRTLVGRSVLGGRYVMLESDLAVEPPHGPERVFESINGSMGTYVTMIADVDARGAIATYTAAFADRACILTSTGKRILVRGCAIMPGPWSLGSELAPTTCRGDGEMEIVDGNWPDLRIVAFEQGVNYSGAEGSHGDLAEVDAAEVARWPATERDAYVRGPGFSVMTSRDRKLVWFADTASGGWLYRLRDDRGRLIYSGGYAPVVFRFLHEARVIIP